MCKLLTGSAICEPNKIVCLSTTPSQHLHLSKQLLEAYVSDIRTFGTINMDPGSKDLPDDGPGGQNDGTTTEPASASKTRTATEDQTPQTQNPLRRSSRASAREPPPLLDQATPSAKGDCRPSKRARTEDTPPNNNYNTPAPSLWGGNLAAKLNSSRP
jgi:hypothetical protein